jgi:hypothetical protein
VGLRGDTCGVVRAAFWLVIAGLVLGAFLASNFWLVLAAVAVGVVGSYLLVFEKPGPG